MVRVIYRLLIALTPNLCFLAESCLAQVPLPDNFAADYYLGDTFSLAVQPDGKVLVGGSRLNPDGTFDDSFGTTVSGQVTALALQTDGKILIAGSFTAVAGQPRTNIARLNPDGSLDGDFKPAAGLVMALAIQADGKILIGGSFTELAGQPRTNIARLNEDGTLDTGFNPETSGGAESGAVNSLALQPDGRILLGGSFTQVNSQARLRIARLNADGTLDGEFSPGAWGGSSPEVDALAVAADGSILLGGWFTTVNGQPRSNIARLNSDGSLDQQFVAQVDDGVRALALQADGKMALGGLFTAVNGQSRPAVARLNADGTLDSVFAPQPGFEAGGGGPFVRALAMQSDGKLIVSGVFGSLAGLPRRGLGRLNPTGPVAEHLSFDGSAITWLRSGGGPEVWRTSFESSSNHTDWAAVGSGSRIPGGWQSTGASVPPGGWIRARGYVAGSGQWYVEDYCGKLFFVGQPGSRTNDAGTSATFTAAAAGTGPLGYQWFKDGVALVDGGNVGGALSTTLSLSNVIKADEGSYSLLVTNASGTLATRIATLSVTEPIISNQPGDQVRNGGESVSFTVAAAGTPPFAYQWWKKGVALAGQTGASLELTNLQATDAGRYWAVVTNRYGSVTSRVASLTVYPGTPLDPWTQTNSFLGRRVAYAGNLFFGGSGIVIITSIDGLSWTQIPTPVPFSVDRGFAYGKNTLVAQGWANCAKSFVTREGG